MNEIVAFELKGWELVAENVADSLLASLHARARAMTALSEGRYVIELTADAAPERVMVELATGGARVVSLLPVRETLEDYFIRQVQSAAPRQTGID